MTFTGDRIASTSSGLRNKRIEDLPLLVPLQHSAAGLGDAWIQAGGGARFARRSGTT